MLDNLQLIPPEAFAVSGDIVEKVIDKISSAVGWLATPKANKTYQMEAERYLIEQIKNDPHMPAFAKAASMSKVRKLLKEYSNQYNILSNAMNFLNESANPEKIDDDWLVYFFDKAKNVSKEEMAVIFGKILAKEINSPGTVSKTLVQILSVIDYEDAKTFLKLANFSVMIEDGYQPVIFYDEKEFYSKHGLSVGELISLDDTGLIQTSVGIYSFMLEKGEKISYFDFEIKIEEGKDIEFGNVILTKAGSDLMSIITDKRKINGFEMFFKDIVMKD